MITDVNVWPIVTDEDKEEINHAAEKDGGRKLIAPTHFVTKKENQLEHFLS